MLSDITISNYRTFDSITVPFSPGVNLIVGTNNSGKSSLLEAIYLLTSDAASTSLLHLLNERGEYVSRTTDLSYEQRITVGYQAASLFYGRSINKSQSIVIESGSNSNTSLSITLDKGRMRRGSEFAQIQPFFDEELPNTEFYTQLLVFRKTPETDKTRVEALRVTDDDLIVLPVSSKDRRLFSQDQNTKFLTTNFVGYDELAALWDTITLTPQEEKVVEALQILEPTVERISFTSSQASNRGVLLKLRGERNPVSLSSMGDGMRRALAVALALVSIESGTLLVDEIDTGFYYNTLTGIWSLILETASRQNVQVFATTHSWDCVKAFQSALKTHKDINVGQLIRIDKLDDGSTRPTIYSSEELEIAVQQGIEVR